MLRQAQRLAVVSVDRPVTFPMMFAVVYLCSKLGQVTGIAGNREIYKQNNAGW